MESKLRIKKISNQYVLKNILGLSLFFIGYMTNAQVISSIDTAQIRVGEEIIYSIQVETDSTDLVLFPEGQSFNPMEVIESYEPGAIAISSYQFLSQLKRLKHARFSSLVQILIRFHDV